ncbi:MAG: AmmeMemoRadiSam system protein A [Desulfobacterota bacterium]|nr:AmmeMemoRadiSam system protein A [Thermodesulfobacteriota bacterium]
MRPAECSEGFARSVSIVVAFWICMFVIATGAGAEEKGTHRIKEKAKEGTMSEADKLTEEEGKQLVETARKTIQKALFNPKGQSEPEPASSQKFQERRGTFVTLTLNGALRGCIGHIIPQESLLEGVRVNAMNAAFRDPRFRPLSQNEFEKIRVEVSILTAPKPLSYSDANDLLSKLRPGADGLIIRKGYHQATFLPQVWEQLPNKKDFLTHLCLKAGLAGDAWVYDPLEVHTYQVQAFEEE